MPRIRVRRTMKVANPNARPTKRPIGSDPSCRSTHHPIKSAMGMARTASITAW
jgi:hypothetical protein